jgi:hypothetical protein
MFGHGKYNPGCTSSMIALFSAMTSDEKHDIMSLNFRQIWYRIWFNHATNSPTYFAAKVKYETNFVTDGGTRLRSLLCKSSNSDPVW